MKFRLKRNELKLVNTNPENPLKFQICRQSLAKPVAPQPEPTKELPVEVVEPQPPSTSKPVKEPVKKGRARKQPETTADAEQDENLPIKPSARKSRKLSKSQSVEKPTTEVPSAELEQISLAEQVPLVEQEVEPKLPADQPIEQPEPVPVEIEKPEEVKKKVFLKVRAVEELLDPEVLKTQMPEKRRGRPPKEASIELEIPSTPEKVPEIEEQQPQLTSEKRRGRPPKKEASIEQKESLEQVEQQQQPEQTEASTSATQVVDPVEKIVEDLNVEKEPTATDSQPLLVVQDPSMLDRSPPAILDKKVMPKKSAKGRGRAAKKVLPTIEAEAVAEPRVPIEEEKTNEPAEIDEEEEIAPKRTLRKRGAAAVSFEASENVDQVKIAKLDENEKDQTVAKEKSDQPEEEPAAAKQPVAIPEEKIVLKTSKEPLKLIIANDKKEGKEKSGLKIVIRSPEAVPSSSEASKEGGNSSSVDAKYVVQSSNENPLKIKLKTSDKIDGEDGTESHHHHHKKHHRHHHHKSSSKGLKLKLLLKTADGKKVIKVGGSESCEENKEKKKKKKLKLSSEDNSESKKSLVLRIKSPNPSEIDHNSETGGNGLHKFKIQKSKLPATTHEEDQQDQLISEPVNPQQTSEDNKTKQQQPKLRKIDEAIKKYVAKITEAPTKKRQVKRKISPIKVGAKKKAESATTSEVATSNSVNHEEGEKLPPIKTKIVLNRPLSTSSSSNVEQRDMGVPVELSSHDEVEKIDERVEDDETQQHMEQGDKILERSSEIADKEVITQELSVRVRSLQRAGSPTSIADKTTSEEVNHSSPIVAFSPEKKPSLFSQDSKDDEEDDDIGLAKGTFNDLMKVIDDDEDEEEEANTPSTIVPPSAAASTSAAPSVEHLQVIKFCRVFLLKF